MSYVKNMLRPGEQIVFETRTSKIAYAGAFLMFLAIFRVMSLFRLATTELALTDKRILGKSGVFRRKTLNVPLNQVALIKVHQGLFGKMLDFGDVIITAKDGDKIRFRGIVWPLIFQQEAEEAIEIAVLGRKLPRE